jgi:hypothetical protein
MTGLTQGYAEVVACSQAGASLSDSATALVLNTEQGSCYIPPNWWAQNKGVHLHARGIITTPSSGTSTLQLGATADVAQGTLGALLFINGTAVTPISSAVAWFYELELELICQSVSGGNAAVVGMGELTLPATATQMQAPYAIGSTTPVNLVISTPYFLEVYGKWTTAVASCTLVNETVFWIPN